MTKRITIHDAGGLNQSVHLDGEDISSAIRGLTYHAEAWQPPKVELDLAVVEWDADLDDARLHIPDATRDLLIRFGWTPPAEESA